ncbi:MAG: hypothetical protein ACAH09_02165 [Methylophilaceae bacterium]
MFCPACNSPISATDARCIQCRTLLIESSEKKSAEFTKSAHWVDSRIYYGIGGFLGFLVALAFFFTEPDQLPTACAIGAGAGGLIGKFVARKKWLS